MMAILTARQVSVELNKKGIIKDINLDFAPGTITAVIGPNGSGKSTLLKVLARIFPCKSGTIELLGKPLGSYKQKALAQKLAILPQAPEAPSDLTVRELVALGRFPYNNWYQAAPQEDAKVVEWALEQTNLFALQHRLLATLSGGERQRSWIAMALAQKPQVLLLDEPTTYLDICHQLDIMNLLAKLNQELGLTIIMVLHDLNHALQYASQVLVMQQGTIVAKGSPQKIITTQLLRKVFGVEAELFTTSTKQPALVPLARCK